MAQEGGGPAEAVPEGQVGSSGGSPARADLSGAAGREAGCRSSDGENRKEVVMPIVIVKMLEGRSGNRSACWRGTSPMSW